MTAPRIDTVRSDIRQAIELLHFLGDQLDDLHVLAYNRHRASERVKVRGGSVDYALDTHGDKRARDLYAQVAKDVLSAVDKLTGSIKGVRGYLTSGAGTIRRDATADCTHDEVIAALDAQRRRRQRGEYQPAPLVDQPKVWSQTEWRTECEALRSAVRKVIGDFVDDHQTCQATELDHRGQRPKLPRRFRLKLLTPREREAWHRANQSVSDQNDEKAS